MDQEHFEVLGGLNDSGVLGVQEELCVLEDQGDPCERVAQMDLVELDYPVDLVALGDLVAPVDL